MYKKAHNGSNPMSKMSNESREDYLEAIYLLTEQTGGAVRSVRLAEFMGLSKASICKAVAGLKEEGCISMDTDYLIALTATGLDEAKRIYRKHRYFERQLWRLAWIQRRQVLKPAGWNTQSVTIALKNCCGFTVNGPQMKVR